MPLNSAILPAGSCHEFGLALRAARERRGITLTRIADATKLPAAMFAALERGDLRHWPKGLYRRSFFRDYAQMIGLAVPEAYADFVRLFPDDEGSEPPKPAETANAADAILVRLVTVLINAGRRFAGALSPASASKVS